MESWGKVSRLGRPFGVPSRVDLNHPLLRSTGARGLMSWVAQPNGNFVNIAGGAQSSSGALTPGVAPIIGNFVTGQANFASPFGTSSPSQICAGAIIILNSLATDADFAMDASAHNSTNNMYEFNSGVIGIRNAGTQLNSTLPAISTGVPYFALISHRSGNIIYSYIDLRNGKVQYQINTTAHGFGPATATWACSNAALSTAAGFLIEYSATTQGPTLADILQTLYDPWAFWYPQQDESWVGTTGGLPPGKQYFDTAQPDPNAGRSIQLRSFEKPGGQLLLTGQDKFNPGKQLYDRQPDPQDSFAQWRAFAGWYNLNLIGKDQFNPGQQSYATPDAWLYPDPFSKWRSWTGSYNLNLISKDQFNPGQQRYDLPPAWTTSSDTFAQWRSWTGSYNLNLIGQDKLPTGKQSYDLPASQVYDPFARWRSWTWSYNLNLIGQDKFNPGQQSYATPDAWFVPERFAQWRSWTGSYNLNLIGQDRFPPGKQWNELPRGVLWQPESPPQNLVNTLLKSSIAATLPPGVQIWELPPRTQDSFAQWRSWTGSYNLNLIGQDQFPPGAKLYDRQPDPQDGFAQWRYWSSWYNQNLIGQDQFPIGAQWDDRPPDGPTWRVDAIPPNLLPTLIGTPVAIPPGKQLFERPRFFFLM